MPSVVASSASATGVFKFSLYIGHTGESASLNSSLVKIQNDLKKIATKGVIALSYTTIQS